MSKLIDLMKTAISNGIKTPKLRLGNYKFSKAGSLDCIWVTDQKPYGSNNYYGLIEIDTGVFKPTAHLDKTIEKEIVDIMYEPAAAAKVFGQKTGTCCCCGRLLVNKTSVKLMIGPICLEKYGFSPTDLIDTEEEHVIDLKDI